MDSAKNKKNKKIKSKLNYIKVTPHKSVYIYIYIYIYILLCGVTFI